MRKFVSMVTLAVGLASPPAVAESIARIWNEQNLAAIRIDFPDPPVHARNLFHHSVAIYDAWAAYDATAIGYMHRESATAADVEAARHEAISYAAYRVLAHRYQNSASAATTLAALAQQMSDLGYATGVTTTVGTTPAAVGNRVAATVLGFTVGDGSNEAGGYADATYAAVNDPLILLLEAEPMSDVNRWQPLAFDTALTQNGLVADQVQTFLGSAWGETRPFALHLEPGESVFLDPGMPPQLGGAEDAAFKENNLAVLRFSRSLDPDEASVIDVSPGSVGNNSLGTNDGTGHALNPVTAAAYAANPVNAADYGRVLAEFWADGPDSETPPGHWNSIANEVAEHPSFSRQIGGVGPVVDELEWDAKVYFVLNGALHDAAIAAWDCKRAYDYVRPISSIRELCRRGQSSDSGGASYDADGMPLEAGLVELITTASVQSGERHEELAAHVGEMAVYCWGGEPSDPETEYTGNRWILGVDWLPYQRDTFVTPAFAGYVSGHSCFSRAAAEVLTAMTGSAYFPGGLASVTVPAGDLEFELGPSADVTLQWATYYDAADQAGISRLYGGIHVAPDDGPGRIMGSRCGQDAWQLASQYFDGSILDSLLPVSVGPMSGSGMMVEWEQHRGLYYKLQSSPDLESWGDLTSFAQAESDRAEYENPPAGEFFFRVVSSGQP